MVLRALLATGTLILTVWLLRSGLPLGAVGVVALAIVLRRSIESRRLGRQAF